MNTFTTVNIEMRAYRASDHGFFRSMSYESIFVPPGDASFPLSIIDEPHLARYYIDWGKEGDLCHIAEMDDEAVGAIWTRHFTESDPGYGFVAKDIPELGIALKPDWTEQGIGTRMMAYHLEMLSKRGIGKVSLSVDVRNRAFVLYQRLGFEMVKKDGNSAVMLLSILEE